MKKITSVLICILIVIFSYAQSYTPAQADSVFKNGNWNETLKAYTWLIDNGKTQRPGMAWYRIALADYSINNFANAIPAFKKALTYNNNPDWMYNLACTFNLAGNKDSCYTWLNTAVHNGFIKYNDIVNDKDLSSLHNDEQYKTLLQKIKAIAYPCSASPEYRQFDFWIGEWNVFDTKTGTAAGKSKIELLLGECVIMENWSPTDGPAGKSFNIYNTTEKKWRQTYVDANGTMLEFYNGEFKDDKMQFHGKANGNELSRLTFFKISNDEVRQLGENSKDGGATWQVVYDLTYKK